MKATLILITLLIGGLLQSCQCSDKPDVGPVGDERNVTAIVAAVK